MAKAKGTSAKLEDWLFAHISQPMLTPDQVKDAARNGRRHHRLRRAVSSATLQQREDRRRPGRLLEVNSTPTFFINGRRVPPSQILAPQYFDA